MARLEQDKELLDKIWEYIFTMNNDDLREVLNFIESLLAGD
jgi:hypothetical protein